MATPLGTSLPPDWAADSRSSESKSLPSLAALRVLVVGLGRFGGGVGVVRWLAAQGAKVTVTDQAGSSELTESIEAIADLDVALHLGGHDPRDLDEVDLVVVNPAVRKDRSKFFQAIERRGISWTTEINLFCERCPATVIGVSGSYGKSTTCAMLAEVLRTCRRAGGFARAETGGSGVHLGGNIGKSLLSDLATIRATDMVVLELSSAQLEDLPRIEWAPPIAVITNLHPHHLDRYESVAAYARAKLNIVCDPRRASRIIVGDLDPEVEAMLTRYIPDHAKRILHVRPPARPFALRVPGEHNQANAACVAEVCGHLGLHEAVIRGALAGFEGLPHRMQHVRTLDGVDYYNDSKSTSPAATRAAVVSLDRPIVAIVGGQDKSVSLSECAETLVRVCRLVICIGPSGPAWAKAIRISDFGFRIADGRAESARGFAQAKARGSGGATVHEVVALEEAVALARAEARAGDAVLFSPGAPSFDRYANFARRGRHFMELICALQ